MCAAANATWNGRSTGLRLDFLIQGLIIFAVAFIVTYAMVPVSRKIATAIGAIDYPGNRRINTTPVPRCGGIALYVGFMAACATLWIGVQFCDWQIIDLYVVKGIDYAVLIIGISVMFLVGLIDDVMPLSPRTKLAGQIVAAAIVTFSGVSIDTVRSLIDGAFFELGWANFPLTIIYLVAFVNIINLIDGLDGLAAGIVIIVSSSLLYLVILRGSFTLSVMCLALIGACLAFLRFNFYPASVFMGDCGSLFLGLVVGIVSISGIVRTQSLIVLLVPIVIAGVPVLDTLSAIVRRRRAHHKVDEADLGHIHHRLVRAGFGQRKSVCILYACSAVLAVAGSLLGSFSGPARWTVFAVLAVIVVFVISHFNLFKPVLQHYYDGRGQKGPRVPPATHSTQDK